MPDKPTQDTPINKQKIAELKWVLLKNVDEIMNEQPDSGATDGEFDVINSDGLARTEIFYYFTAHSYDQQPREPLLTLGEIAQIVIPYSFQRSETLAKEIVSHVGQQMLRKFLISKAVAENNDQPISDDKLEEIEEEVEIFNLQRRELVKDRLVMEKKEKDPDYYLDLSRRGREAIGQHSWTDEENARLNELIGSIKWPKGHRSAGKTNWEEVARFLSEEFNVEFTGHQVKSVVDKRRRTAWKKGINV